MKRGSWHIPWILLQDLNFRMGESDFVSELDAGGGEAGIDSLKQAVEAEREEPGAFKKKKEWRDVAVVFGDVG